MKAVRFHQYGGAEVLRYEDVEVRAPGPQEVRIRVAGSTFNPVDDGIRGGYLREVIPVQLPHTPGVDVSGTVDAVGEGVTGRTVGDRVVGFLPMAADGSAAEYVIAPAEVLAAAPVSVPLADAAALASVGLTAWQALMDDASLTAGQRVLINGAGGAVGSYAVQLAKHAGAYVIATASSRSRERVSAAGADEIVDHTTDGAGDRLASVEPVDVLLNLASIGPDEIGKLVDRVRDGGVVVNSVPAVAVDGDEARGVRAVGVFVRSDAQQLSTLVGLVDSGELHIDIAERVSLSDLPKVHARAGVGELSGKVVITVDEG